MLIWTPPSSFRLKEESLKHLNETLEYFNTYFKFTQLRLLRGIFSKAKTTYGALYITHENCAQNKTMVDT